MAAAEDATVVQVVVLRRQGWLQQDIADAFGVSLASVGNWTRRDASSYAPHIAKLRERNRAARGGNVPYEDREWLRVRYEDRDMTMRDIAAEADCGLRTIARWRKLHEIPARLDNRNPYPRGRAHHHWTGKGICECGARKSNHSARCRKCASRERTVVGDVMAMVRMWTFDHWRLEVFARDGYRCMECGDTRGGNLHAHHKVHLSAIVRDRLTTWQCDVRTMTPDERWELAHRITADPEVRSLDNGITLCAECHWSEHERAGWLYPLRRKAA